MTEKYLKPKQALNPAFRKVKPNRSAIESFKANLIQLVDRINESESEEFHKNLVSDFLKKTYYDPSHFGIVDAGSTIAQIPLTPDVKPKQTVYIYTVTTQLWLDKQ